jgi:hypothetical protein
MRYSPTVLFVLCLLIPAAALLLPVRAQDPSKQVLPADATWKHRWDYRLDGELKEPHQTTLELSVRNNHITGRHDARGRWAGEIVPGKVPVVMLRQDSDPGFVVFYCGKLVEKGRIVGTFYNTAGESGDFEIVLERE